MFKSTQWATATLAFVLAGAAHADLGTMASWNGTLIGPFGAGSATNTATYGQTITATPSANVLESFSFAMTTLPGALFKAYVFNWDGEKATGPALFTSAPLSTGLYTNVDEITVETGRLSLTPGSQYMLAFSTSGLNLGLTTSRKNKWGLADDTYSGGGFFYLNNGADASAFTATAWDSSLSDLDLAFTAKTSMVSAVPEPSTRALFLFCLATLGAHQAMRRSKASVKE
jgi:hypothetical protein